MVIIVHVLWVVSRQANMFLEPSSSGSPASRRRLQYLDGMLERNPVMSCRSGLCLNHFKHVLLVSGSSQQIFMGRLKPSTVQRSVCL
jgi:hypothetical protein